MLSVSKTLRDQIKLSSIPAYRLALDVARCHPTTFSKLLNGAERLKPNDERIVAVGRALGVTPEGCFEETSCQGQVSAAVTSCDHAW